MSFLKSIKNSSQAYIAVKSKFNPKEIKKNKEIYKRIKNLNLIDEDSYVQLHKDCLDENLEAEIHYIFYGFNDDVASKKSYINSIFDLDFYIANYNVEDPIIDFVLNGFFKNNTINSLDDGFITSLDIPLEEQFFKAQNNYVESEIENNNYITDKKTLIPYLQLETPIKTNTIRVGVFINDPFENLAPCPYIRLHAPLKKLSESGDYTFFMYGMDSLVEMDMNNMLKSRVFDIIIVQRILPFLDLLKNKAKRLDIKLIYETDDDLLGVEKDSPSFEYVDRVRNELENFIKDCDIVTVTTNELASRFNHNYIEIIPNYYVDDVFSIKKDIKREGRLKLGYYGTLTHSKDLFLIKDVIKELKNKYDFDFEVIGGFNAEDEINEDWYTSIELPPNNMNFKEFMPWLSSVADWDIALVPLEDSFFNRAKSELKYIELTVLGIPGVYSDMVVYNSVIDDGYNGLLAGNYDEWIFKIEQLVNDIQLREGIRVNALGDVLNNYSINSIIAKWNLILKDFS